MLWLSPSLYSQSVEEAIALGSECLGTDSVLVMRLTSRYCIINGKDVEGYAIVSVGRDNPSILGYSKSCVWREDEMPPVLMEWLDGINGHEETSYSCRLPRRLVTPRVDIPPLLTCHWHQSSPYNDLCPVIEDGNVKTAAGCVAIAAAQVVYYWRDWLPLETLKDTPVYPYGAAPVTMSIPKGTLNNWDLLRDEYGDEDSETSRAAVAQLVYVIGTTSYLQYAASTGGQISEAANTIYAQFRMTSEFAVKANFEQEDWERLLYESLEEGCPIIYSGSKGGDGHAVVVDGYDASYGLFHFNFGWGGSGDGFYTVNDETGMNGYYRGQQCVHKIVPQGYQTKISTPQIKNEQQASHTVYSINGIPLQSVKDNRFWSRGIPHGIYIQNGQKVVK